MLDRDWCKGLDTILRGDKKNMYGIATLKKINDKLVEDYNKAENKKEAQ